MREFFAGKRVRLLTIEEETNGVCVWHAQLEEQEIGHMTGRLEDTAVFLYVTAGSLVCQVNQDKEELKAGDALFVNCENAYRLAECGRNGVEFYLVTLERKYLEADEKTAQKYVAPVWEREDLFCMKFTKGQEIVDVLQDLGSVAEEKEEGYELKIRSLAFELWFNLCREVKESQISVKKAELREKNKLCQMLEFLHEHYKEKITLGELAQSAGVSTGEYCRFFKKKMGRTPFEYLQAYRIEQSIPEILEKSDTIANIALRHGFTGSSYFTETFKKEMGCAPGDYRKWYKGETEECPLKEAREEQEKTEKVIAPHRNSMPAHLL